MLDDPMLLPRAAAIVREQRVNAEWAVQQVFHEFSAVFEEVADPYLRERQGDVADLVGRLRMNLRTHVATPRDLLRELDESSVLVADELTPSLAAQVDWTKVRGFATDAGSRTYHTAILARSLDVPAVVGLHNASEQVQPGQLVVIDGDGERADHRSGRGGSGARGARTPTIIGRPRCVDAERRRPAATADGVPIRLDANIEFPDDLAAARYAGAEGIGLYRSEFLRHGRSRTTSATRTAVPRSTAACSKAWRRARSRCARSTSTKSSSRRARRGRRRARPAGIADEPRAQPAGPARPAPQPDAARSVPDRSCARCCARRGTGRCGSCSRSCRASSSCARRGGWWREAAADLARRGEHGAAGADRRDDRDSGGGATPPICSRARSTSSPSAPTT